MNKKSAIIFFLILASVIATWLIEQNKPTNSSEVIAQMNQLIAADPRIKSHVWNYSNVAVGVIKTEVDEKDYARSLCAKFIQLGAKGVAVQVVDVLKLQNSGGEDWEEIAYARCD
ncbi:hypothetical protein [Motiliproteus sp. MSK22-1]|uniref:hypothetical protein n=1 Tax=Motiliproteus sp. MSK22-1 TaxID=1897630 RepID=UPI000975AFFF|nr:hypothetical protein [Motiliproteus sp. MSK22-1]OMH38142.1 hypothetical protein BGP75_07690 [Motiliproteus sp. MSK22-1]